MKKTLASTLFAALLLSAGTALAHDDATLDASAAPNGGQLRTDLSATLFLTEPEDYDGGELLIDDTFGAHKVKLKAGSLILYPATSLHRVTPVTRGSRVSAFFWIQSMVRDDGQRTLLFDLDMSIQRLRQQFGHHDALVSQTGVYHNLLRRWAEP